MRIPGSRFWAGVLLGGVVMGGAVASLLVGNLVADLPDSVDVILSYRSPLQSVITDATGEEVLQFALVEPIDAGAPPSDELVEAFFAASSQSFYEARSARATPAVEALQRAARGAPPQASPLSTELARVVLGREAPGLRRRVREEVLASRFDADSTVVERGRAWLEWVPLCDGRRGLRRAAKNCIGVAVEDWGPEEYARVAAAATASLDLRGDAAMLLAWRDAVLDRLVVQGRLDAEEAVRLREDGPSLRAVADGPTAWSEAVLAEVRRVARSAEPQPIRATTWLDSDIQLAFAAALPEPGASWAAIDSRSGGVLALGGAAATQPSGALDRALDVALLLPPHRELRPRLLRSVDVEGLGSLPLRDGRELPVDGAEPMLAAAAYSELLSLRGDARSRRRVVGTCRVLVSPQTTVAACGASGLPDVDLGELLATRLDAEFVQPDAVWMTDEGEVVLREQPTVGLGATQ